MAELPPSRAKASSSSASIHNKDHHGPQQHPAPADHPPPAAAAAAAHADHLPRQLHKKQFVVGGSSSRLHSRVPSHGRNLNKLGVGKANTAGGLAATSPRDKPRSARKPTFELGDSDSDDSQANSYKDGYANGGTGGAGAGGHAQVQATKSAVAGLTKSSSTRSLDREARAAATRKFRAADRSRSKSGDRARHNLARQRRHNSTDALTEMTSKAAAAPAAAAAAIASPATPPSPDPPPPQQFHPAMTKPLSPRPSSENISAATTLVQSANINTPNIPSAHHAPITPAHSLPSSQDQILTSRFLTSPHLPSSSSAGTETPVRRADSTVTLAPATAVSSPTTPTLPRTDSTPNLLPSRTQQKLWLQRASSQHDVAAHAQNLPPGVRTGPGAEWYLFQGRAQKEFERVGREYMNVRRFKDPVAEGVERMRFPRNRIPNLGGNRRGNADGAGAMGLSQSLKETRKRVEFVTRGAVGGVRDDSAVADGRSQNGIGGSGEEGRSREQVDVQQTIARMWARGELLASNE